MKSSSLPELSICMIVKNEASILGRCIESIKLAADEIVIVDTGSEDNTVRIAESYGVKLIRSDWRDDFSYSRNISINHAKGKWILWLDADDIVPSESIPLIDKLKRQKPDRVYGMIVRNEKPNGTGTEFIQARMFPNHPSIRFERPIHEQIMPSALRIDMRMVNTDVVIEHHGYADSEDMARKAERNVSLMLKEYDQNNPDPVLCIEVADSYTIVGDPVNARKWYEKALSVDTCERYFPVVASQAHIGLGNILNKSEEYEKAVEHFNSARKLCPERSDVLYCLAVSHEMMGQRDKAVKDLIEVLDMKKSAVVVGVDFRQTRIKSYLRLIRILKEMDSDDELEKYCSIALKEYSSRAEIQNMVGIAFYHLERIMDALHCFERSLEIIVEGNIDAYIGLCMIYIKAGRKNTAEETIIRIQKLFEYIPRYWALCFLTGINNSEESIPENISKDSLGKEKEYIAKTFFHKRNR